MIRILKVGMKTGLLQTDDAPNESDGVEIRFLQFEWWVFLVVGDDADMIIILAW